MKTRIERTYFSVLGLFWLGTALPLALMVLFMQARGMSLFQVGLLMGSYSIIIVLLEVPTGGLADAVGRKRIALLSNFFALAAGLVILFAFSFWSLLAGWLLMGISRSLSSGALEAWFIDSLQAAEPGIDLQPSLARAETVSWLSIGTGTIVGGILPKLFAGLPAGGAAVLTPLSIPLVIAGILRLAQLLVTAAFVQEERPPARLSDWVGGFRQVPSIVRDAFKISRRSPVLLLLAGGTLAGGLALSSVETFWQPFFAGLFHQQPQTIFFGAVMAACFLAGMAGNLLSIPVSRLLKRRYGLVTAIFRAAQGLALVLMALQNGLIPATGLFWLTYAGMGAQNSPAATLINREIPAERRSSMLSVVSLVSYLGSFAGSAGLGWVAERASISAAWLIAGSALVVSLLLYLRVDGIDRQRTNPHDAVQTFSNAN